MSAPLHENVGTLSAEDVAAIRAARAHRWTVTTGGEVIGQALTLRDALELCAAERVVNRNARFTFTVLRGGR